MILEERHVVTCFLKSADKILILRRSEKVGTYQGRWAGVSGYVETNPDEQALTEIREETGLEKSDIELMAKGAPIEVIDEEIGRKWIIHPYLFHIADPNKIKLDWEHKELKWIIPGDMGKYETVPELKKALESVYSVDG